MPELSTPLSEAFSEAFDATTLLWVLSFLTIVLVAQLNCWIEQRREHHGKAA
jgi:hypothetical protein